MNRPADILDYASELTQQIADHNIEAVRNRAKPEQVQNEDGSWPHEDCIDCGEEIPAPRLSLGKIRCIDCQTMKEKRNGTSV